MSRGNNSAKQSISTSITVIDIPAAPGALNALADALVLQTGGAELAAALEVAYTVRTASQPRRVHSERLAREEAQLRERLAAIDRERAA
jgi:hypothetical protein